MSNTFRVHFDEDIARAESLLDLVGGGTRALDPARRRPDIRLAAVGMAVAAMDAYFCDAYVDCLTHALRSYREDEVPLPDAYARERLPVGTLLSSSQKARPNWRLRMASRQLMEKKNILDLGAVTSLFNPVLPPGQQLWEAAMPPLIALDSLRLTGVRRAPYDAALPRKRAGMRKTAAAHVKRRVAETIQWRHDWVHNCGRPKVAIMTKSQGQVFTRVREVKALVHAFDDHLSAHRTV